MNCPTCRKIVAANAYNCPNCGHKFRSTPVNIFFKIIIALIVIIIVIPVIIFGLLGAITGVTYYSLSNSNEKIAVPQIVGKDFAESENELNRLGLKIKIRGSRLSKEKSNTVLEQAPRAGELVITGQTILVVVSQLNQEDKDLLRNTNNP